MQVLTQPITRAELKKIASKRFITLVKAVVDVEKEIIIIDADLHADEEAWLLEHGSKQENLWGINLLVDKSDDELIEFDSMINLRPSMGNMSRGVESEEIRKKIKQIVKKWIL